MTHNALKSMTFIFFIVCHCCSLSSMDQKVFLIFGGKSGWIGQKLVEIIEKKGHIAVCAKSRLENRESIEQEINLVHPDMIINAAGLTGRPNVDWCESHKQDTVRSNIIGALNLADISFQYNIHLTNIGTGCIYQYDEDHPMNSGIGFKEDDVPNFSGSYYSATKVFVDKLLMDYPNVLNLRLRMPISSDFSPRNFIVKITKYKKLINIPNSVSVLDDLLPLIPEMAFQNLTGNYNFTNPGTISHNEILTLYTVYIDPDFHWENFTVEEQNHILKAERSNNELDVSKLLDLFPDIPHIRDSIIRVFEKLEKLVE